VWPCFDNADKALTNERSSILLDYLESRLEDHFQVVNAIAIQDNSSAELKQLVEDLLTLSRELLQEIHAAKSQRETENTRSTAWIPSTEASTEGRPSFRIYEDQIETLRETGMNWKTISLTLGISESTPYRHRQEFGLHDSFVDIVYEELYTVLQEC